MTERLADQEGSENLKRPEAPLPQKRKQGGKSLMKLIVVNLNL
jgi:hypothetical protein